MTEKKNCWEFKKCGRERGGREAANLGCCPAAEESSLHGVHGGRNAGRTCWVVAGTFCQERVRGTSAARIVSCEECDFYRLVQEEEFPHFEFSSTLLARLHAARRR